MLAAALVVTGSGCAADSTSPASRSLPLAFSLAVAGPAAAFDRADRAAIRLQRGSSTVLDTVIALDARGADVRVRLRVDPALEGEPLLMAVEIRLGADALFRGSASITPTAGASAPASVTLQPVVARIEPPAQRTLTSIGGTLALAAAAVFATGDTIPDLAIAYTILDPGIIRLLPGGSVQALAEGSARVEARAGPIATVFTVAVRPTVASVTVSPSRAVMFLGTTQRFTATPLDGAGNVLKDRTTVWSSSNSAVLTVDELGQARAAAVGAANVVATIDGVNGSAQVTVSSTPPPAAPTGLFVESAGTTITLVWTDNATNETSYEVHRGPRGGVRTRIALLPPNSRTHVDTTNPADRVLDYSVLACGDGGCSESAFVTARTVPAAPTGLTLTITDASAGTFTLRWQDLSVAEARFEIEARDAGAADWSKRGETGPDTERFDGTGTPGKTELFRVLACNEAGCSGPTNLVSGSFALRPPQVMTFAPPSRTELLGFVDGWGSPYTTWFQYADDPAFSDSATTQPMSSTVSRSWSVPLYDLPSGVPVFFRIVAQNAAGFAAGAVLMFSAPNLTIDAVPTTTLCNGSRAGSGSPQPCPTNPASVTISARSTGPVGTYANPFSNVAFELDFSPTVFLGNGTVTVNDDAALGTRTYTYTYTWTPDGLAPGTHYIFVRGYTGSTGGNVLAGIITFSITID